VLGFKAECGQQYARKELISIVRCEVLTAVFLKIQVSLDFTPYYWAVQEESSFTADPLKCHRSFNENIVGRMHLC
jgi:hypothetical protein